MSLERAFHKRYNRDKIMQTADSRQGAAWEFLGCACFCILSAICNPQHKKGWLFIKHYAILKKGIIRQRKCTQFYTDIFRKIRSI